MKTSNWLLTFYPIFLIALFYGFPVAALNAPAALSTLNAPVAVLNAPAALSTLNSPAAALNAPAALSTLNAPVAALNAPAALSTLKNAPVAVIAFGAANLGHPKFVVSPNAYSFSSLSSFSELAGDVLVECSIDALSNDPLYSYSSNPRGHLYKKMEHIDSNSNPNYSYASGTNVLPKDATTSHCRKRCPRLYQGQHRYMSQAALSTPVVRQT